MATNTNTNTNTNTDKKAKKMSVKAKQPKEEQPTIVEESVKEEERLEAEEVAKEESETEDEDDEEEVRKAEEALALKKKRLAERKAQKAEEDRKATLELIETELANELAEELAKIAKLVSWIASVEAWKTEKRDLEAKVANRRLEKQKEQGVLTATRSKMPTKSGAERKTPNQLSAYTLSAEEQAEVLNYFQEKTYWIEVSKKRYYLCWSKTEELFYFNEPIPCGDKANERVLTNLRVRDLEEHKHKSKHDQLKLLCDKIFGRPARPRWIMKVRSEKIIQDFHTNN